MTETIESDDLYHYTTQEGLIGILETNCLWATHYKFLNDYSELIRAKEKIAELFKDYLIFKKIDLHSIENESSIIANHLTEYLKEEEVYITSFCKNHGDNESYINENGLLSQWRAYGINGGYAIILNENKLEKLVNDTRKSCMLSDSQISIKNIVYSDDDNNYKTSDKFVEFYLANDKKEGALMDFIIDFATRYKDCGFKEEKEVRIVVHLLPFNTHPERRFRSSNNEQIPYIELFGFKDKKFKHLPIKKIIVGPHKDKEARAAWLRIKLASLGRSDIEVTVSKIPFVGR